MLSSLGFLIYGESANRPNSLLNAACCVYLINKNLPIRDDNNIPVSVEKIRIQLEKRIAERRLEEFRPVLDAILDRLAENDSSLYYFVLTCTLFLSNEDFECSLKNLSMQQDLMFKQFGEYRYKLYSEPLVKNGIPQLAWDITPALDPRAYAIRNEIIPNDLVECGPVDEWGLLSQAYRKIMKNEALLLSIKDGQSCDFFDLEMSEFWQYLLDTYRGKSSDLFQINGSGHFYQAKNCHTDKWNMTITKYLVKKHLYLVNLISDVRAKLNRQFVRNTNNSIRLMVQSFVENELFMFWEYIDCAIRNVKSVNLDVLSLPPINFRDGKKNHMKISDELYELFNGYYHVLKMILEIITNINNYSPITLNEIAFVGSKAAPLIYSRGMWRRLNVNLIRFIVKKTAEMLTAPDAELFELLDDAGDSKLIRDPSIWQRLNPLKIDSSKCIDFKLERKLVDLVIGYRFFVNDKKHKLRSYETSSLATSNNQEAEEIELISKTKQFNDLIDHVLERINRHSFSPEFDELSSCIGKLISSLPTVSIVEKYSLVVLEDSIRFFNFLKKFFTSVYLHINNNNGFLNIASSISVEQERMHNLGYDRDFLRAIDFVKKSTQEEFIFKISPPEPLNVYVTDSVMTIYSQTFTVLNMLQTALDAVVETHNCETLKHEPRLRYCFYHMNTAVFTIRKNMLTHIEAAYENMKQSLDFESSVEKRSAHECLNVCYKSHRKFLKDLASILMITANRGSTTRIVKMMVSSVSNASRACISDDAVSTDRNYQQFLYYLSLFLDQCKLDRVRYELYRSLEISKNCIDGESANSSYSDDLSCRSY